MITVKTLKFYGLYVLSEKLWAVVITEWAARSRERACFERNHATGGDDDTASSRDKIKLKKVLLYTDSAELHHGFVLPLVP